MTETKPNNIVDLTESEQEAVEVMAGWKYPDTQSEEELRVVEPVVPVLPPLTRKEVRRLARRAARQELRRTKEPEYLDLLEQERDRLEEENRGLRDQLVQVRTQKFNWDGTWSRHLSYVDRPGEWYWYNSEDGQRVWDDWSEVTDEPNWWEQDNWRCGLTQYFQLYHPRMVPQVDRFLARWAGEEWSMWDYIQEQWPRPEQWDTESDLGEPDESESEAWDPTDLTEEPEDIYWCREELEASYYDWYRSLGYTVAQAEVLAARRTQ